MLTIRVIEGDVTLYPDGRAVVGTGGQVEIGGQQAEIPLSPISLPITPILTDEHFRAITYDRVTCAKLRERYDISPVADKWLAHQGKTRQNVSNAIGLNRSDLNKKYTGAAKISRYVLDKILAFHGVTLEQYLAGPEPVKAADPPETTKPETQQKRDVTVHRATHPASPAADKRPPYHHIGKLIKLWLKRVDPPMKQVELANLIHVSDVYVSQMINEVYPVQADVLDRIIYAVGAGSMENFMSIDQ